MRLCFLLIPIGFLFACENDGSSVQDACVSRDPMEEVEWLIELKNSLTNCTCETSIIRGKYLDETVFYVAITDPACLSIFAPTLYDCSGKIVRKFNDTGKDQDDLQKLHLEEVLYRCND